MSNSPDKDLELSALLRKAEPPKSPAHVDEAILRYARENAPAPKQSLPGDWSWLQRHWVSAAATFSVAAIAISVSLPYFSPYFSTPELASTRAASRTEELALGISAPSSVAVERQVVETQALQAQAPAPVATQEARLRQEFSSADAAADTAVSSGNTAARRANAAQPAALAAAEPPESDLAAAEVATTDLITQMRNDVALQDTVIIALRRALGVREQSAVVRRGRFIDEVGIYIETWRGLRDATILSNVQNRYSEARADLLDARLPETVAELVTLLETL